MNLFDTVSIIALASGAIAVVFKVIAVLFLKIKGNN